MIRNPFFGGIPKKTKRPDKVKFQPETDLILKDTVKGTVGNAKHTPCVNELIEMLDCLKRTGFHDLPCTPVILAYAQCNKQFTAKQKIKEDRAEEDLSLISSSRDLKRHHVKQLLRNYPVK